MGKNGQIEWQKKVTTTTKRAYNVGEQTKANNCVEMWEMDEEEEENIRRAKNNWKSQIT